MLEALGRVRAHLLRPLIAIAALYIVACSTGRVFGSRLVYPAPQTDPGATLLAANPRAEFRTLTASDGTTVHAIAIAPEDDHAPYIAIFHGNGDVIGSASQRALVHALASRGFGVLSIEYRGYGISRGPAPKEAGLYLDAKTALDDLASRGVSRDRTILLGISLGTGVASEMAARGYAHALILMSPFTSMTEMAAIKAPFLPTSILMTEHFDTLSKASRITIPTLIIHGTADELVPFTMGETLAKKFPHAKLLPIDHGHHNDLFVVDPEKIFAAISDFVRSS
jgi:alpha-beta hydrolase superfamily lysophospholipase